MSAQLQRVSLARGAAAAARRQPRCSASATRRPAAARDAAAASHHAAPQELELSRRAALGAAVSGAAVLFAPAAAEAYATKRDDDGDFVTTDSGLRILELRPGTGDMPRKGDVCVIHWDGYTSGYQGKRIDNTSVRDEPYEFVLGGDSTIAAFDEAVSRMRPGAVVRVEVPGEVPGLSYPIDRKQRFTDEVLDGNLKTYRYRKGPQPAELGGQRALDFVLDNRTLQDFNRMLLFDIRLLSVRRKK